MVDYTDIPFGNDDDDFSAADYTVYAHAGKAPGEPPGPEFSHRPGTDDEPHPGIDGTKSKMSRFVPMSWADLEAAPRAPYLVKGFLDKGALGLIYGPSNSGKTFAARTWPCLSRAAPTGSDPRPDRGGWFMSRPRPE